VVKLKFQLAVKTVLFQLAVTGTKKSHFELDNSHAKQ